MSKSLTVTAPINFALESRGRRRLEAGAPPQTPLRPPGRVPRVARLMALAIRFEEQVRTGVLASYSALAELGHVTRARVSQIMNLVNLAPDMACPFGQVALGQCLQAPGDALDEPGLVVGVGRLAEGLGVALP